MKWRFGLILAAAPALMFADSKSDVTKRIGEAAKVFEEINATPDKGIPQDLLEKAHCIGIVPGLKRAGFIVGGQYGKGVLVCRTASGWSGPSTIKVEGGSIGLQIGAGETDLVFVVMNERGMEKLMEDKFTVGADAGVMAGPVGRSADAKTDAQMHAQILAYSRARGVFAGITLNGSTLRPDKDDNAALYGANSAQRDILSGKARTPAEARTLHATLTRFAPMKKASR